MKVLVIYDSLYGNTEKVAKEIASGFLSNSKVKLQTVNEVTNKDLENIDLLIIGSPTQGGRPTKNLSNFLSQIPNNMLSGVKFASFDTRFEENLALKLLMKTIGYAAPKIAASLKRKGGMLVVSPEGFIVKRKEGPLSGEELKKAKIWAEQIAVS